ncbi:helix-turn-helix domain-containing protein [Ekhidna sp.]
MISDSDILKLILGFKIKHLRNQRGISYQSLSEQTGLSVSYLNDIEKGKKYPKPDKIRALSEAFNISYDDLVSTQADKKLLPVIDLLKSGFFKYFPSEEFGMNTEKLIDFFSNDPDRISAFISTILKMTRSYQIEKEHFYRIALRSYQDMHDNYFPDLEDSASDFRKNLNLPDTIPLSTLENLLSNEFSITIKKDVLSFHEKLHVFRSYYQENKKTLFLNDQLSENQHRFLIAKEIGYQYLKLDGRSYETYLNKEASFEKLLNNFKASYFAAALLVDQHVLASDLANASVITQWNPKIIQDLLDKYQVTPETLLQRFTNILPKHFGIDNLFFIRIDGHKNLIEYQITKELHISGLHKPYQNQLTEHLCHRWVSISSIKNLEGKKQPYFIDAQISDYWQTDNSYFCISVAEDGRFDSQFGSSVTIGLSMTESLRATFNFIKDPNLKRKTVHTTCENCSLPDCDNRVAPPSKINIKKREAELIEALKELD